MNHPPSDNKKADEVIDRLISEVRRYKSQILNVRYAVSKAGHDYERLTVVGGVNRLAQDNHELRNEIHELRKELDRAIKGMK